MAVSAFSVLTFAESEITSVELTIDAPNGGKEISFTASASDDAPYAVDNRGTMWENYTSLGSVTQGDVATAGSKYLVYIDVLPKEGYTWPDDLSQVTFTVNGKAADGFGLYAPEYEHDGDVVYVCKEFIAAEPDIPITQLDVLLSDLPIADETFVDYISGLFITYSEGCFDNGVKATLPDGTSMNYADKFAIGEKFGLQFTFKAIDGYVFADDVAVDFEAGEFADVTFTVAEDGKSLTVSGTHTILDRISEFLFRTYYYEGFYTPEDDDEYVYYYRVIETDDPEKDLHDERIKVLSLPQGFILDPSAITEWTGEYANKNENSKAVLLIYQCKQTDNGIAVYGAGAGLLDVYHLCTVRELDGKYGDCYNDGWRSYYKCTCGRYFEDAEATKPIDDIRAWRKNEGRIPAPIHFDFDNDGICNDCGEPIESPDTGDGVFFAICAVMVISSLTVFLVIKKRIRI